MAYTTSGQWSMPPEETNGYAYGYGRPAPTRRDTAGSHDRATSANRNSRTTPRGATDSWNIMSDSEETKQRRMSLKSTNAGASRKRSRNTLRDKKIEKPAETVDDSAWIHRDKLAQIEIMEMEQAGIPSRVARRSVSTGAGAERRNSRSRSRSRKAAPIEDQEQMPVEMPITPHEEDYDTKRMSAIPAADEDEYYDPNRDYEFRTPQELAAEQEMNRSQLARPSTSRIPVSKISPVPVPSNVVGRDSPLPRSRQGSTSGTWDDMQYQRKARSGSIGSNAILDDGDGLKTQSRPGSSYMRTSDGESPPKFRTLKSAPNGRNAPNGNGVPRPGSSHGNKARTTSNNKERTTSGGHKSRPSTSHAYIPEGDPPWISSMYKPDPRLPPDQQMLPTHAKRMMQEQWEKEGKGGSTYDRDFRLVSDDPLPSPGEKPQHLPPPLNLNQSRFPPEKAPSPRRSPRPEAQSPGAQNQWPLTPDSERKTDLPSPRPGTSGGYKITPTIHSPPQIQRPETSSGVQPSPVQRMPDFDEKDEAKSSKGGCACCVMM